MIPTPSFKKPDEKTLLIAMVLQDIKDILLQQKNTSVVTIDAEKPNSYFWAQYDPRDEEMWFDDFYGDVREVPFFSMGIATDKERTLELLLDKGVIKSFIVNSEQEDPIGLGLIDFVRSFKIELNAVKFLKYYDAYTKAAKPALNQYLALSGEVPLQPEIKPEEPQLTQSFSAKLSLNSATKTIRLTALGKTVDVKKFGRQADNYIMLTNLYRHPNEALTRKGMGVLPKGSLVKDIPKTMGFSGEMKSIFFTVDSKLQTLTLHPEKVLTPDEAEIIQAFVNSNTMKK